MKLCSLFRTKLQSLEPESPEAKNAAVQSGQPRISETGSAFRIVGWTSVALGIAAVGLYVGRELRLRYKFSKRTPYDIFSHAGDAVPTADYGVGI